MNSLRAGKLPPKNIQGCYESNTIITALAFEVIYSSDMAEWENAFADLGLKEE